MADWKTYGVEAVSYTHLDVYKRQSLGLPAKYMGPATCKPYTMYVSHQGHHIVEIYFSYNTYKTLFNRSEKTSHQMALQLETVFCGVPSELILESVNDLDNKIHRVGTAVGYSRSPFLMNSRNKLQ